jgi:hypothetical protein
MTDAENEEGLAAWHAEEADRVAAIGAAAKKFGYLIDTNEGDPDDEPDNDDVIPLIPGPVDDEG